MNFSKDKLNLSRAERQSGFADSRFSTHQYSVHGSSVQSDGFSKYKGLKKGGIALGKGKANRIKKGSVFEWIFGGFFNDFFCYNRLFERGAFARQFILVVGYKTRLQLKIIYGIP